MMMRREATTTRNTHDGKTHIDDGDDKDIKLRHQTQKAHELATQIYTQNRIMLMLHPKTRERMNKLERKKGSKKYEPEHDNQN